MRPALKKQNIRFRERLAAARVIAMLRGDDAEFLPDAAQVLYDCGLRVIEVSLATPGSLDAIGLLRQELGPDTMVGAGAVRTLSDVDSCVSAGADFLATPTVSAELLDRARLFGLPVACGALTPTEVDSAWRLGAAVVKVLPVGPVGGVSYVQAVHASLPEIPLVPACGIELDEVDSYLGAGAFAVGAGCQLIGDALSGGRLDELGHRASQLATLAAKFA
ncbi:bifunctional 4-hydroxy-2-oxoglutarate aldolase/2-dehydro-3-deoxy-phosphogluconate aldolase [Amycolatopsis acidicola]|uniref:Bifunctional 4-hydroxy-2-oxoglutarate aldolase/2-dehydro-3-deoxy-phosphogluconate aldolase n=1 Tax=Amycolatopsis acidicola TaxID=2596893 RepID=A0A5N0VBV8_9PSEU|nr:bifunctional 4-hydroxy-2-oxoglutarate aldolase/2-dehydro-3-deoxy-phosphogluconate aldolase [Amycolatopsis acidicola]KAA9162112.1 bifunctional 4-hydroxy-2-oxoglutarate aldolase/2-dehydro-3-deoxy-phosphogluconate aldolase [Amycolatopsis acidicola]